MGLISCEKRILEVRNVALQSLCKWLTIAEARNSKTVENVKRPNSADWGDTQSCDQPFSMCI